MPTKPRATRRRAETPARLRARLKLIITRLEQAYPDATCALQHRNPLELLVATILSARSSSSRGKAPRGCARCSERPAPRSSPRAARAPWTSSGNRCRRVSWRCSASRGWVWPRCAGSTKPSRSSPWASSKPRRSTVAWPPSRGSGRRQSRPSAGGSPHCGRSPGLGCSITRAPRSSGCGAR